MELEKKGNGLNQFKLLTFYSEVRTDLEDISELKAIKELKKELESIPYKYAMSDDVFLYAEVKENYPLIYSIANSNELYVPDVLERLAIEIGVLEVLNSTDLEGLTEETYFSIEDYFKEISSVNVIEEPVEMESD